MPNLTMAEYLRFTARQKNNGACKGPPSSSEALSERNLHEQILAECKRLGWLVFHGSMAHATFRTPGEPDFIILAPPVGHPMSNRAAMPRVLLIECKTKVGKLSPEQRAVHAWAEKLGHKVHVVRTFAEFLSLL